MQIPIRSRSAFGRSVGRESTLNEGTQSQHQQNEDISSRRPMSEIEQSEGDVEIDREDEVTDPPPVIRGQTNATATTTAKTGLDAKEAKEELLKGFREAQSGLPKISKLLMRNQEDGMVNLNEELAEFLNVKLPAQLQDTMEDIVPAIVDEVLKDILLAVKSGISKLWKNATDTSPIEEILQSTQELILHRQESAVSTFEEYVEGSLDREKEIEKEALRKAKEEMWQLVTEVYKPAEGNRKR